MNAYLTFYTCRVFLYVSKALQQLTIKNVFLVARFFVLPQATFSMVVPMEIKNVRYFYHA